MSDEQTRIGIASWLAVQFERLRAELRLDFAYLSEEVDRWGEPITPFLLEVAPLSTPEGRAWMRCEIVGLLASAVRKAGLEHIPAIAFPMADCQELATSVRECRFVRLPSDAVLSGAAAAMTAGRRISA